MQRSAHSGAAHVSTVRLASTAVALLAFVLGATIAVTPTALAQPPGPPPSQEPSGSPAPGPSPAEVRWPGTVVPGGPAAPLSVRPSATPPAIPSTAVAPMALTGPFSRKSGHESCRKCHAAEAARYDGSIHRKQNISCVECHGGDASKTTEAEAMTPARHFKRNIRRDKRLVFETCAECHSGKETDGSTAPADLYKLSFHAVKVLGEADFAAAVCTDCHGVHDILPPSDPRASTNRLNVPRTCEHCHGDDKRMNPYGIPTDQYKKYVVSQHGSANLAHGNTEAAICIDCHRAHDVLPPDDPQSPIYPANVPATCGRCHEDAALMAKHGKPSTIPEDYREGVHGQALLAKGTLGAPHCAACHGNHMAVPPGFRSVATVCGKCHPKSEENYAKSVHTSVKGFRGCIECHSNHRIAHPSADLFTVACVRCHPAGSKPFEHAQKLKGLLQQAASLSESTAERLKRLKTSGYAMDKFLLELTQARQGVIAMGPGLHTLSLPDAQKAFDKIKGINDEVLASIEGTEMHEAMHKLSLLVVTVGLLCLAGVFYSLSRTYEEEVELAAAPPGPGTGH